MAARALHFEKPPGQFLHLHLLIQHVRAGPNSSAGKYRISRLIVDSVGLQRKPFRGLIDARHEFPISLLRVHELFKNGRFGDRILQVALSL